MESLNRRSFLKILGVGGGGLFAALYLPGCQSTEGTVSADGILRIPKDFDQSHIDLATAKATQIISRVTGLEIDHEKAVNSVTLVDTDEEFVGILLNEQTSDTGTIGAFTVIGDNFEKHVYVSRERLTKATKDLGDSEIGNQTRADFFTWTLVHEMGHFTALGYKSPELEELFWGEMLGNNSLIIGRERMPGFVSGATISTYLERNRDEIGNPNKVIESLDRRLFELVSFFQNVEEVESEVITDFVWNNRGQEDIPSLPPAMFPERKMMFNQLIQRLGDKTEVLKHLVQLRSQENGREEWCKFVAETLGIEDDQILFSLSVFFAIELNDTNLFNSLVSGETSHKDLDHFLIQAI
ncbi:hypothetical protein ACFL18_02315 [Patescibacteria group bacterium]